MLNIRRVYCMYIYIRMGNDMMIWYSDDPFFEPYSSTEIDCLVFCGHRVLGRIGTRKFVTAADTPTVGASWIYDLLPYPNRSITMVTHGCRVWFCHILMFLFRSSHWSLPSSNGSKVRRCAIWSLYFSDPGSSCAGLGRATEERSWKIIFQDLRSSANIANLILEEKRRSWSEKTSWAIIISQWWAAEIHLIFERSSPGWRRVQSLPAPAGHFKSRMPQQQHRFLEKEELVAGELHENLTIWLWLTVCHGKSPCYQ